MGLVALVVEHHEELEHDLLPEIDLLDLWRGRLTFRRLELLIRHLPAGSATSRALDPDAAYIASWDSKDYLLALLADLIGRANFQNWKPIPRPAEAVADRRRTDARRRALVEKYEARQRASTGTGS